jgi:DNA-binding LacI/PurR family transcriptional regulator
MGKQVTQQLIAEKLGVHKTTVSMALKENLSISPEMRARVKKLAEELGYYPNASAKALMTKRTGYIGFILSDVIADGLSNSAFSQVLAGVEVGCRNRGYGLNVSLYNLSNIGSFVFPQQVGQRSVDGLVLTGYVEAAVVQRFREFDIPCVCIGDNVEIAGMIPTVACDFVDGLFQVVVLAAQQGHRRILYCNEPTRRGRETGEMLIQRVRANHSTANCQIKLAEFPGGIGNYSDAKPLMEYWLNTPSSERATTIIATDQVLMGLTVELDAHGLRSPRDISLVSTCDTRLCEFAFPPLCAVHYDLVRFGEIGANLLIDHLDDGKPLTSHMSRSEPCTVRIRRSFGEPAR